MRVYDNYGRLKISTTGGVSIVDPKSSITIEMPANSENASWFHTKDALVVTRIQAVVRGTTPSVTWTIRFDNDRSAAGTELVTGGTTTTSTTSGDSVTILNTSIIPNESYVWFETTANSGIVNEISVTLYY